jgi:PD-(D/E)XK nuclease superfamily protein
VSSDSDRASQATIYRVVTALQNFAKYQSTRNSTTPIESEAQLMGALAGFLSSVWPDLEITTGRVFRDDKAYYVDMVISDGKEKIMVELKRGFSSSLLTTGLQQVMRYMRVSKSRQGILFLYSDKTTKYTVVNRNLTGPDETLLALEPVL